MTDLNYSEMTPLALSQEWKVWCDHVESAAGFPSAYFAAKQLAAVVREQERRGIPTRNPHPIRIGR